MQRSNIRRIIYLIMITVLIMTVTGCKRKNADDGALEVHNPVQDESVMPDQGEDSQINVIPVNATSEPETEPVIETETETTTEPTTVPPTTTAAPTTAQETTTVPPTTVAPTTEAPTVPPTTVPPTPKQEATVPPTTAPPTTVQETTVPPTTEAVTVPETTVPVATEAPTVAGMTSDGSNADPNYVVNDRNQSSFPEKAETWPSWSNEFYQQGDPEGFTRERAGGQLYDSEGYGTEGYNRDGFNREGKHWTEVQNEKSKTDDDYMSEENKNTFDQYRKDK